MRTARQLAHRGLFLPCPATPSDGDLHARAVAQHGDRLLCRGLAERALRLASDVRNAGSSGPAARGPGGADFARAAASAWWRFARVRIRKAGKTHAYSPSALEQPDVPASATVFLHRIFLRLRNFAMATRLLYSQLRYEHVRYRHVVRLDLWSGRHARHILG